MRVLAAACLAFLPLAATAQDTAERDRGIIQALLEDNLSGAGRTVRINGFAGALSSRATFERLTIADGTGIWLTIDNGALSWNRSALLSGRVEVNELSAASIELARLPDAGDGSWSEARDFSLPDLPVSVEIGALNADRVTLAAPVLGEAVTLSVKGDLRLAAGEGEASLSTVRTDGKAGRITFAGSYSNATRIVALDLLAEEGAGGLAVTKLGIPGSPPVVLALNGSGPADDVHFDVSLSSDGVQRLDGSVDLRSDEAGRRFAADFGGDLAPLFLPDYRAFFGDDIQLRATGLRSPRGALTLEQFEVATEALRIDGSLNLADDGHPEKADLRLEIAGENRAAVVLPLPGEKTSVRAADLDIGYSAANGESWSLRGTVSGLSRPGVTIGTVRLDGSGRIARGAGGTDRGNLGGTLRFAAGDIAPDDPALLAAIGPFLTGTFIFGTEGAGVLRLSRLDVVGQGYSAKGNLRLGDVAEGLPVSGQLSASLRDVARLSALANRPLSGKADLSVEGRYALLGGAADLTLDVRGEDLTVNQPEADRILAGLATIRASVLRDSTGTTLRAFDLAATGVTASAAGRISTTDSALTGRITLDDLSRIRPGARGSLTGDLTLSGPENALRATFEGKGEGLAIGQAQADRVLAGTSTLSAELRLGGVAPVLERLLLVNPQLRVEAATRSGDGTLGVEGRLADFALIAPQFPGPLSVSGTVRPEGSASLVDLALRGPGGTDATVKGRLSATGSDLAVRGQAQAALANPFIAPRTIDGPLSFDLRMQGRPALSGLSGRVTLRGGRVSAPVLRLALVGVDATAELRSGQANLSVSAGLRDGGQVTVTGPVGLASPNNADLSITLRGAVLRDPNLFRTTANGQLTYAGPLGRGATLSGRVRLGETEISIPSTGFGTNPVLAGIEHRGDRPAVRETRARAGIGGTGNTGAEASGAAPTRLDLVINAPSRVFVRGRGLDAELGGSLRIGGTTAAAVPSGQFTLIRGRLDLLGKRFDMDEGLVQLQGALVPYVRFAASGSADGVTSTILVEGPATEPRISFTSSPQLPEEEIVARLLFGRDLGSLSVFQAAQLASAIASLTGRGGEGVVSRLRTSFGLDDLDIQSDGEGSLALRAGKYLTRNVYTDVTVNQDGQSEIRLNLDVTRDVTLRGRLDSEGETGIGVYFERDY